MHENRNYIHAAGSIFVIKFIDLKHLTIFIILSALLFQTFSRIAMVVDYNVHRGAYIQLCENKDKPTLHCKGQCVLMKKIKKQAEKEAKQTSINLEQLASIHHITTFEFKSPKYWSVKSTHYPVMSNNYTFQFVEMVFHPPLHVS